MDSDEYSDYSEYESEVEYFEDFSVEENTKQEKKNTPTYIELSQQDILTSMKVKIEKVTSKCTNVTSTEVRFLLQSCKWDASVVIEALLDGGRRKEKLYEKAGIQIKNMLNKDEGLPFAPDELICEICSDNVAITTNLGCRHVICIGCLEESINTDVNNRRVKIFCPGYGCKNLLSSDFILKMLKDEKSRSSYILFLIQAYIDSNSDIAGIQIKNLLNKDEGLPFAPDELICEICSDNVAITTNLGCRHVICIGCLEESINTDVNNRRVKIFCPGYGCKNLLSSDFILKMLKDEKSRSSYICLLIQAYIDSNSDIALCPETDCNLAFKTVNLGNNYKVKCSNGHESCFKCQQSCHDPLDCKMLQMNKQAGPTINWMLANTKDYSKCGVTIRKGGAENELLKEQLKK